MKGKQLLIWSLLLAPLFALSQPAEKACFSVPGGFYEESPVLELFPFYPQHHIRFTTNGNRPTAQSRLYTEPLLLDESLYSTSDIYTVQVAPNGQMFYPDSIQHCIVIRAAVFDEDENCISEVATNSYFIHSLNCDTHGLPVISLCSDSTGLFNYYHGIMVPGCYQSPNLLDWTGNYFCKGPEWERVCNIEFYETDNSGINQVAGLRTHGGASRRFQQKGFKVFAREEYGKKRFKHLFFPENAPIDSYKHLSLKPFRCSNWMTTGVQDHLAQQVARDLNLESLASRQAVLFLNGEYWGIYALEESPDQHYLEDHFGFAPEDFNIIKQWIFLDQGDDSQWNELFQWVLDADLSLLENYRFLSERIDVDNFIDYQIFELYSTNVDWPKNNVRCWQHGNGQWRWIFFDGDGCFFRNWDIFSNAMDTNPEAHGNNPSSFQATLFFRKLLDNHEFRDRFKNRFHLLLSDHLRYDRIAPCFHAVCALVEPEVPSQSSRFGFPSSFEKWEMDVNHVDGLLQSLNDTILGKLNRFMNTFDVMDITRVCSCYPNPFNDHLYLEYVADKAKLSELRVFNMLGQEVYHKTVMLNINKNMITLDLPLPSGVYVLKLDQYVTKIIKQ